MRERPRLPDPEYCSGTVHARHGQVRGHIIKSIRGAGFRRRRHECPTCGRRWTSWQMIVRPHSLFVVRAGSQAGAI